MRPGVQDLASGEITVDALLVSMAAPRLHLLGIPVPTPHEHPESRLYELLVAEFGDGAHARYNALVRRMVSFARAAAIALRAHA